LNCRFPAGLSFGRKLKPEEFFAKSILVSLLCSLDIVAKVFLSEMRRLPFIDFGNVMIDRGQRFFLFDCCNPFLDCRLIGLLHLV